MSKVRTDPFAWGGVWLLVAVVLLPSGHVSAAPVSSAAPGVPYVEGEAIVTFKETVYRTQLEQVLHAHGWTMPRRFAWLSEHWRRQTGVVRAADRTTAALIAELRQDPAVELAETNYLCRTLGGRLPDDPLFAQLWALQNTGQSVNGAGGVVGADLHFVGAWSLARPSTNPVVVAVIDTGVDYTHPDLAGNMWTNTAEIPGNGLDDDANGYADDQFGYDFVNGVGTPTDAGEHGTHVAGTIAALGNNQVGVIGVNCQARIMALKASGDGIYLSDAAIIEALQYAAMMKGRGVNLFAINASFGGGGSNSTERAAIQAAGDAGIVFCAAAGNSSLNHDLSPDYPSAYRLPNMIVVAASDQSDALASFSDFGATTVDLAAPGVNILSAKPLGLGGTVALVQTATATNLANSLVYADLTSGITAPVYYCGLGYPEDFPVAVRGNIALIQRGTLFFSEKVASAMAAGARAAIIFNNVSGNFTGTLQYPSNWIPAVSLSQADGLALQAALPLTATVVNAYDPTLSYQFLNGTSMATPHVVGAVSFAALNFPDETVAQRIQRVLTNVDLVAGLEGKVRSGGRLNLQRLVDTDGNGLPDWWEQANFGHLTGSDPLADPDHDRLSNLAEWWAGTDPNSAASGLRLTVEPAGATNGVTLRWPSVAGRSYRVERATNLLAGFTVAVRTNLAATPPLNILTDPAPVSGNARYYRVGVEP